MNEAALSSAGNYLVRTFTYKSPEDWVYRFNKQLGRIETYQEPYCQVSYGQKGDGRFLVVTYAEGDVTYVTCETREDLDRELQACRKYYAAYRR